MDGSKLVFYTISKKNLYERKLNYTDVINFWLVKPGYAWLLIG